MANLKKISFKCLSLLKTLTHLSHSLCSADFICDSIFVKILEREESSSFLKALGTQRVRRRDLKSSNTHLCLNRIAPSFADRFSFQTSLKISTIILFNCFLPSWSAYTMNWSYKYSRMLAEICAELRLYFSRARILSRYCLINPPFCSCSDVAKLKLM